MSSITETTAVLYSSGDRSLSIRTSSCPFMDVNGVLSSWEALAMKFFCIEKDASSLSSILLKVLASLPISSVPFPSGILRLRLEMDISSTLPTTSDIGFSAFPEKNHPAADKMKILVTNTARRIILSSLSLLFPSASIAAAITTKGVPFTSKRVPNTWYCSCV